MYTVKEENYHIERILCKFISCFSGNGPKLGRGNIQISALYSLFPLDIANVYFYQTEKTVKGMQYSSRVGITV